DGGRDFDLAELFVVQRCRSGRDWSSPKEGYTMPEVVSQPGHIRPGDIFEDCRYQPCFCYDISDDRESIFGISLIDGSTWQCSVLHCGVRKLTPAEAWRWKNEGPADVEFEPSERRMREERLNEGFQIRAADAGLADVESLADVLIDCVEGGASVSFMAPLTRDKAVAFWHNALNGAGRGERGVLVGEDRGRGRVVGWGQGVLAMADNQS